MTDLTKIAQQVTDGDKGVIEALDEAHDIGYQLGQFSIKVKAVQLIEKYRKENMLSDQNELSNKTRRNTRFITDLKTLL